MIFLMINNKNMYIKTSEAYYEQAIYSNFIMCIPKLKKKVH